MVGARTARTAHYGMTMNDGLSITNASADRNKPVPPWDDGATPSGGASSEKCFVCGYAIEHCFCKIHRTEGGPMLICCPDCVEQYLDALHGPLDLEEQERRAFAKRMEMFIGVDKPWSLVTATIH